MTTTTKRWAKVTLQADGMGDEASEEDFEAYVGFVAARIDERVGFVVDVDAARYGEPGAAPRASDEETRELVVGVLQDLWNEWCDEGAPVAPPTVVASEGRPVSGNPLDGFDVKIVVTCGGVEMRGEVTMVRPSADAGRYVPRGAPGFPDTWVSDELLDALRAAWVEEEDFEEIDKVLALVAAAADAHLQQIER